ncbi:MAG: hypothetical protein KKC76_06320 [Proteobacteria bacterium]|nr:hypothetical protein [Pseudomonadota bacterium]MBU4297637.1 hypothetical protein [Pseudomonadota bacterium]MCG2750001.1 hypothetical protein [Desulfobulbaceae bacterium]
MPITYKYDPANNILRSYHSGTQTVSQICEHFKKVAEDPTIKQDYIEVAYCADDIEFDFTSHTARLIPIRFSEMKYKKTRKAAILIGATQLQYGIARMMKNLHEVYEPKDDIRVVRSEEEVQREINCIILAKNDLPRVSAVK